VTAHGGASLSQRALSAWPLVLVGALVVVFVAAAAVLSRASGFNQTTTAFVLLIAVLLISALRGLGAGLISALIASAAFNYYFLPPTRTWVIEDPENWIALFAFLIASVVASQLLARMKSEAAEAEARRREVEALYVLSLDLFSATARSRNLGEAVQSALESLGASGGGLVLFDDRPSRQKVVCWTGEHTEDDEDLIAGVGRHWRPQEFPPVAASRRRDVYLPLLIGGEHAGVLAVRATGATMDALEAAATLVALAVERERFIEERAHLEALRESDMLKTSLLRAVSHDLNSPLTAIGLQLQSLRRIAGDEAGREMIGRVEREAERLRRRIENLLSLARLEAGTSRPRREPTPPADLLRATRESLPVVRQERPLVARVEDGCPDLDVDPTLALEILVNLVENAHRASPAGEAIEMVARAHGRDRAGIEILDRGPGPGETSGGDGDAPHRGLGLEIARSLAAVNGGTIALGWREGGGTIATVDLPAALLPPDTQDGHDGQDSGG
jgi:two-component system, OmpR family, sensor histidine kinase KdpD